MLYYGVIITVSLSASASCVRVCARQNDKKKLNKKSKNRNILGTQQKGDKNFKTKK